MPLPIPAMFSRWLPLALALATGVEAQLPLPLPPLPPHWTEDPESASEAGARLRLGRDAVAAGQTREAVAHLNAALAQHPASMAILTELLRATAADPDAKVLLTRRTHLAAADERGQFRPTRDLLAWLARDPFTERLATTRAAAVAELARFTGSTARTGSPGSALVARHLQTLAAALMRSSPALHRRFAPEFQRHLDGHRPDYTAVLTALRQAVDRGIANTTTGTKAEGGTEHSESLELAIRAARCLTGLAAQAAFKDLEGPTPPELRDLSRMAREARARVRQRIDGIVRVYTVEELAAMDEAERDQFTERHSSFADPAVAMSPGGRYRIETTCGHGTLLGAAQTVELHHQRLVAWFGRDPFEGRPGLIRIVPDSGDLEAEDAPFWWAGGFQSGDLTVLKFSFGTIGGLGRGLTHELTHRFDGVLVPFLPAWLTEGRAVWTGTAYGRPADLAFVERHLNPWSVQTPYVKGYGSVDQLTKLLEGTIDDYRDNYTAGYALFTFLKTWRENDSDLFSAPLQRYLKNIRAGTRDRTAHFVSHFADGRDGRPADLAAFCEVWQRFLHGCYRLCWGEPVDWMEGAGYVRALAVDPDDRMVLDKPTFVWEPDRAEPWFGQEHARRAARVLHRMGNERAALAAHLWALETDPWSSPDAHQLADLLVSARREDAAWVVRHEDLRRQAAGFGEPMEVAPFLARLPALRTFLDTLEQAARADQQAGRAHASRMTMAEHNELAQFVGKPALLLDRPASSDTGLASLALPFDGGEQPLGLFGWIEQGLTGYEERRAKDHWFATGLDLHVGRARPRDETGLLDRAAHQRHAFTHTRESFAAGRYVVRTRVHFTTSYVSGCIVLGYQRRDRNVRVNFTAGDFLYSIGRKDDAATTEGVTISVSGLHPRESHLPGSAPRQVVKFEQPLSSFLIELHVDGARLDVFIEGERRLTYSTPDGSPIEGHVGFAMGQGAVRLQQPTLERRDRSLMPEGNRGQWFDLRAPGDRLPSTLDQVLVRGVPLHPSGTVVFFVPLPGGVAGRAVIRSERLLEGIETAVQQQLRFPQEFVLMVPTMEAAEMREVEQLVTDLGHGRITVVTHGAPAMDRGDVFALFVDPHGRVRSATTFLPGSGLTGVLADWCRRYRERM